MSDIYTETKASYFEKRTNKIDQFIDNTKNSLDIFLNEGEYNKAEIIRRLIERIISNDFCYKEISQAQKQEIAEEIRVRIVELFDEFAMKSMLLNK